MDTQFELAFNVEDLLHNLSERKADPDPNHNPDANSDSKRNPDPNLAAAAWAPKNDEATAASPTSASGGGGGTEARKRTSRRGDGDAPPDAKPGVHARWLVPLVVSSYDFSSCTGNRSVIHRALLPLTPVILNLKPYPKS